MTLRFVHMADVHLDTPFKSSNPELRKLLRDSIRQAFKYAVDLALSSKVHALLIGGDLFDNDTLSFATEKFLLQQFYRLKQYGIDVFYSPGNHDPYGSDYGIGRVTWPDNVHIFGSCSPISYAIADGSGRNTAAIVGAGHQGKREARNLVKEFPKAKEGIPHIGLVHTLVSGSLGSERHDRYAPCSTSDLTEKGYAYWALGHVHSRAVVLEEPLAIYPGNLVGRNAAEDGVKGVYLVEINDGQEVNAVFHGLSPVCWQTIYIDSLDGILNFDTLEQKVCACVEKELENRVVQGQILLRIHLKGPCPLYRELKKDENIEALEENLKVSLDIDFLELLTDGVTRPVELLSYRGQPTILGSTLDILSRLLEDDEFLLDFIPEAMAGCEASACRDEKIKYVRSLLDGLDYEAAARLLKEDQR